jgi:DNA-binding CsgD family transcriptional regulator
LAAIILGRPLSLLWQRYFMIEHAESPSLIDITVFHFAIYLLVPVLLVNKRFRVLVSASFAFSIINLAHLPVTYFALAAISHLFNTLSYVEVFQQNPLLYYSLILLSNIVIVICCLLAAHWLRQTKLKPPLGLYVIFNLLFVLFPLMVLVWYEGILAELMSIPFLTSAFLCSFFLVIVLFLFYLYTRLTLDNHPAGIKETKNPLPQDSKVDKYRSFIQRLSRRELEVIESVLAGNISYKEPSVALNISVNTVKAHLKHIYKTTGVSNIAALSSLFHGFSSNHPKITS